MTIREQLQKIMQTEFNFQEGFDEREAILKLLEEHKKLLERVIKLENKLKSHTQDEFGHTWEQRQYD